MVHMLFISQCIHPALLKKVSGMRAIGINPYSNNQLCYQRLRLYAVRDCGLLSCPLAPKFERGRTLELPLEPLLHIAFVRAMCIIFLEVFKYKFYYFVFTQTDFFFVPYFRFRCHFLNFSLLSKMIIRISFLAKWFVPNRTIV